MVRQIFEGLGGEKYGKLVEEEQKFEAHIWQAENMGWGRNLKELDRASEDLEGVGAGSFEVWVHESTVRWFRNGVAKKKKKMGKIAFRCWSSGMCTLRC